MSKFEPGSVRSSVALTAGVELAEASAARTARMLSSVGATLDLYAGHSLFDTEPAQLAPALSSLKSAGAGK